MWKGRTEHNEVGQKHEGSLGGVKTEAPVKRWWSFARKKRSKGVKRDGNLHISRMTDRGGRTFRGR